jgi:hypothetical protein
MNQIFGYKTLRNTKFSNGISEIKVSGANPINSPLVTKGISCYARLFSHPHTNLQTYISQEHGLCCYVWGIPSHPKIPISRIAKWCTDIIDNREFDRFKELLGSFIVIADEPTRNRITFVTDILGVRPIFLGKKDGVLLFGSEVWTIHQTGMISDTLNYNAISAWIAYGCNYTDNSLFADLHRLSPGSVTVFQDEQYEKFPYATFQNCNRTRSTVQVSEELHEIGLSTVTTLLKDHPRTSLALSGGYDSRYLLALSGVHTDTSIECVTVSLLEEVAVASQVAEALDVCLKKITAPISQWDLYDEVYHYTPDGFPISKMVTYRIAQQFPGIPMINGFMGDSIMRGSKDKYLGKYEDEYTGDLSGVLQRKHQLTSLRIFRKDIAQKIQLRSRVPMERAVREGASIGKIFGWADYYYRQRLYISNNFLQHLGLTEALLPFYSWPLLAYKIEHDKRVFNSDIYDQIFAKYFTSLSKIPHTSDLPKHRRLRVANCTKKWARQLLPKMYDTNWLPLLSKKQCVPLLLAGIVGHPGAERHIHNVRRLYLLEKRLRDASLDFDWEHI